MSKPSATAPPRKHTASPTASEASVSASESSDAVTGAFEVGCAVEFIAKHLNVPSSPLTESQSAQFQAALTTLLLETISTSAWIPHAPHLGNARRSIMVTPKRLDKTLARAADASSVPSSLISTLLPSEMVLWVDPGSVCYRAGSDHAPIVAIWEDPAVQQQRLMQQQIIKQRWSQTQLSQSPPQMVGYMSPSGRSSGLSSASSSPQLSHQQFSLPQRTKVTMKMPASMGSAGNVMVN